MSDTKSTKPHLSVLGGGPAGLAVGYYARKAGISFTIYEASDHVGGNCVTLKHGDFLFDSGAHRFHDKIPEVTTKLNNCLAKILKKSMLLVKSITKGNL
jgi:protoporphyrinogen oxidase